VTDPTGRVFDALADPNRRYVLEALAGRATATATELAAELPVTRQAVSKHLAALNEAGLVQSRREGRETLYELTPGPLGTAMDWMVSVGAQWDTRLAALRRHLGGDGSPKRRAGVRRRADDRGDREQRGEHIGP
jgi:DNA-binding transcriptional ArsR family regulator